MLEAAVENLNKYGRVVVSWYSRILLDYADNYQRSAASRLHTIQERQHPSW